MKRDLHPHQIKLAAKGPYQHQKDAPQAWYYNNPKSAEVHFQVNEPDGLKHYTFRIPRRRAEGK